ncbi:MAG: hypothetical protein ABIF85_05750 [Nanoarchaeota archaeon]|nr:hypothetical protein [Nanoarchaeota archaeon]MBU4299882.1 hypothetical protein [Nanoarchaeota archaeon]MBU4451707.1 hypothetical protein [Nanoarchaeota archaeon]MCG2723649.1 hypothetical protein [archaeon]
MLEIQVVPQKTKKFLRAVIFLKDAGIDVDADVSVSFQLPGGKEMIFLPESSDAPNYIYPESTSRFVHRIEKGIYLLHSRNRALFSAKKIAVNVLYKREKICMSFVI